MKVKDKVDLPKLLEDIGFIEDYKFSQGYVRLMHPELIMEFFDIRWENEDMHKSLT
ncbi:MAG: hypothetical protein JW927_14065 [Deltaproteobacteria bacterium]|nr:hypothetical protein [Deltaproteobacteria bacterium]